MAAQEAAGLDVVTDGELRRYAFFGHLIDAVEGFDKYGGWSIPFHDEQGHEESLRRPVVVEKLRWRRQMSVEEFTWLRGRTRRPVKVTLLSAQQAAAYYDPDKSRGAYATRDAYLAVRYAMSRREENMVAGNRNATIQRVTAGARSDGTLTALGGEYFCALGWAGWLPSTAGPMQLLHACETSARSSTARS